MGIFDPGSNNCSTAGKGFNDFLSVISIGLIAGPTDDQCNVWKNKKNNQNIQPEEKKKNSMQQIKEFFEKYKMEIGLVVLIIIIMKM